MRNCLIYLDEINETMVIVLGGGPARAANATREMVIVTRVSNNILWINMYINKIHLIF